MYMYIQFSDCIASLRIFKFPKFSEKVYLYFTYMCICWFIMNVIKDFVFIRSPE